MIISHYTLQIWLIEIPGVLFIVKHFNKLPITRICQDFSLHFVLVYFQDSQTVQTLIVETNFFHWQQNILLSKFSLLWMNESINFFASIIQSTIKMKHNRLVDANGARKPCTSLLALNLASNLRMLVALNLALSIVWWAASCALKLVVFLTFYYIIKSG